MTRVYLIFYEMRGRSRPDRLAAIADSPQDAVRSFHRRMGNYGAERGKYRVTGVRAVGKVTEEVLRLLPSEERCIVSPALTQT